MLTHPLPYLMIGRLRQGAVSLICIMFFLMAGLSGQAFAHGGSGHDGGSEKSAEDESPGPHFAQIPAMQIPVIQNGKVVQILILSVSLEVEKGSDITTVEAYAPLLKDGYFSSLYGALHIKGRGGDLVDIDLVRGKLKETNEKILPPHLVKNILIQQLQQRKP